MGTKLNFKKKTGRRRALEDAADAERGGEEGGEDVDLGRVDLEEEEVLERRAGGEAVQEPVRADDGQGGPVEPLPPEEARVQEWPQRPQRGLRQARQGGQRGPALPLPAPPLRPGEPLQREAQPEGPVGAQRPPPHRQRERRRRRRRRAR